MKLELKHLAPYLPYGLELQILQHPFGIVPRKLELDCGHDFNYHLQEGNVKPILRPIEDLIKEIEIDGLKFIPIMVLFGGENYKEYNFTIDILEKPFFGKKIEISVKDLGSPCVTFGLKNPLNNILNYQNWELLFKWHFDVFELIEKGLAININELKR